MVSLNRARDMILPFVPNTSNKNLKSDTKGFCIALCNQLLCCILYCKFDASHYEITCTMHTNITQSTQCHAG